MHKPPASVPGVLKVLIAEDMELVRAGIKAIVLSYPEFQLAGEARNGEEAVQLAQERNPDVVLMDLSMPLMNGTEATRKIKELLPSIKVIALTAYDDDLALFNALSAGINGYVLKNVTGEELYLAIRTTNIGALYICREIADKIITDYLQNKSGATAAVDVCASDEPGESVDTSRLSPREKEIMDYLIQGLPDKSIADKMNVCVRTIEKHKSNLKRKFGCRTTLALITSFLQRKPSGGRSD